LIFDVNGNPQPDIGTQDHWQMLVAVMADPVVYGPLRVQVERIVDAAITSNTTPPYINSRVSGEAVLSSIGGTWHAEFARRFPNLPNGAARGVFGMALWHNIAMRQDRWCFNRLADPYGYGQPATEYWRI
jgi:hypothetical protein